jgi:hypothetical protein
LRLAVTLIPPATLALAFSSALAEWVDFAPRSFENGALLEAYAAGERDVNRNASQSSGWSDNFFREKVTLFSNGFVYHPRFLQYQLSLSGQLKQESYAVNQLESDGWQHGSGVGYEGRLFFLPEHPYNFELFALRLEPLYRERSATQHGSVETSNGAHFRFRRKPYFFHGGYLDNTTSSRTSSSSVERLTLDGEYFKELRSGSQLSASAFFAPSNFTGDLGLEGDATQYGMNGLLHVQRARLSVMASRNIYDQASPSSGRIEGDQFGFQERLSVDLPVNFKTHVYYRVQDNETTTSGPGGAGLRELTDQGTDLEAILSHRLYESLDTRYIFLRSVRTSSGGEAPTVSHTLGLDYAKRIERGRVLAGVDLARSNAESSGRIDVASESHPGTVLPGTFPLAQPNVDPQSLEVFVRRPVDPFDLVLLVENVHYDPPLLVGNTLQISVTALPPQPEFVPGQPYEVFVSYSLTTGDFELRTDTRGFRTSVALLDNLLIPYYSYLTVRSDVLSGVFPGSPVDSTTNTVGLIVQRGPWRAVGEYQDLDWDVSPYQAWRAEVQHIGSIGPTLRVYATARYLNRYYSDGPSASVPEAYTDRNASVTGSVQKDLMSRSLLLAAGGSYSYVSGIVDSNAYALNASVIWKVGKLELDAGVDAYGSDSQGMGAAQNSHDRQSYYVKVSRRLFR